MPIIPILMLNLLLSMPYLAVAQSAVPQIDGNCPWKTFKSGDYCVPVQNSDGSSQSYIVKQGSNCPYGYFKSGDYCRKGVGDRPEAIPRKPGANCPGGWYKSGDYCWKGK